MLRALALYALIALSAAQHASSYWSTSNAWCQNPTHAKFWPKWISGTLTKLVTSQLDCKFEECPPLFLNRANCNRIGIAYHPFMADSNQPDFTFRSPSRADMPRSRFLSEVYRPLVAEFETYMGGSSFYNIGAMDSVNARKMSGKLAKGDVIVYIANEYQFNGLNDMCHELANRGIIILPVFVGTEVSISQLALLAETQKTGSISHALVQANGYFYTKDTAGLILPAVDYSNGRQSVSRRQNVVMFARLFAQCPGSCLSTCVHQPQAPITINFPEPEPGRTGCCGPVGKPGKSGVAGPPGSQGCQGNDGGRGPPGPPGPAGKPGDCGVQGAPGKTGIKGVPGEPGDDGVDGADGPCGEPGVAGRPGSPGTRGPMGPRGPDGQPGQCGPPGPMGPTGYVGAPGIAGLPGLDGVGMISNRNDGHESARDSLFMRALMEIMDEDPSIWRTVYDLENQYNPFLNTVLPINSCSC